MTAAAEAPLTPAEADLTGYAFMPLFGEQLFKSDFNLEATDAEFRVAVRIWWAAWTQVPAASLPNDEKKLCQLAGFHLDSMAKWKKMRALVMRNFVLCSDGRLYHRVLAPHAIAAWEERKAAIKRGVASGVARRLKRGSPPAPKAPQPRKEDETLSTASATPSSNVFDLETNKGEGEGEGEKPNTAFPVLETSRPEPPPNSGNERNPRVEARRPGLLNLLAKHRVTGAGEHPLIVDRILIVAKDEYIVQAFNEAARSKGGGTYDIGYLDSIVARIAKAANDVDEKQQAAKDRALQATQAQITSQHEPSLTTMPEAMRVHLPRFG